MSNKGLIDRIDKGLEQYWKSKQRVDYKINGKGRFKAWCEESGFDDEKVADHLKKISDVTRFLLIEFLENKNDFPGEFDDDKKRDEAMMKIVKDIAEYGSYEPQHDDEKHDEKHYEEALNIQLVDLSMCCGFSKYDVQIAMDKYNKLTCLFKDLPTDENLKWFFAVSQKCGYPFLTFMVDAYSKDKIKHYNQSNKPLSVEEWAKSVPFMNALKKKQKNVSLESAMQNYDNRIMKTIQFAQNIKINDDLERICEYVAAIPGFIEKLITSCEKLGGALCQIELNIAVNGVIKSEISVDNDDDDEKDTYDKKESDPNDNHIGDVSKHLCDLPFVVFDKQDRTKYKAKDITRMLFKDHFNDFRTKLDEYKDKKKIEYDPKTYPRNRRFGIFIERRENSKATEDPIIFFQHPKDCNKFENKDYNIDELGLDFLHRCILPHEKENITSETDVCGQLMTFMFYVKQKDEIRCYFVWNGQKTRFEGIHFKELLPHLFVKNLINNAFVEQKKWKTFQELFNNGTQDKKYNEFYKAIYDETSFNIN